MLEFDVFIESIFWGSIMKVGNFALLLFVGVAASIAFAQASPPTEPPVLPSAPTAPTAEPAGVSQPKVAEGVLFKSQRLKNDKGTNDYICTYRVAGTKRDVQLDESCPATMVFQLRKRRFIREF